jgi:hypothetical protein
MKNKRSVGVTFFARIYIISGVISLVSIAKSTFVSGGINKIVWLKGNSLYLWIGIVFAVVSTVLGLLELIGGVGALRLIPWSRTLLVTLGMIRFIMTIPIILFSIVFIHGLNKPPLLFIFKIVVIGASLMAFFFVATVWFFTRPKVREQFE